LLFCKIAVGEGFGQHDASLGHARYCMLVAPFAPGRGCADCGRGGAEVRPRSILVVDDKEDIREVLALLLRSRGHTVEIAPDGPAALKVVADFCPEFALVDLLSLAKTRSEGS